MRELFSLDSRLSLCGEFVREGSPLADIGTDHAYLPVHLVLEGKVPFAVAADIASEPLQKGRETVEKYHAEDKVKTRLCGGLSGISPDEVRDIVIAGMGGDTIIEILDAAPWVKNPRYQLVLQPMTKVHRVVKYLYKQGFRIDKQGACEASGKLYTVMAVSFRGVPQEISDEFSYTGILNPEENELHRAYLERQISTLRKRAKGNEKYAKIADKIAERISLS
ncbi:MAG: class I SAM-dependent methyltransferase [Oscillospiraceae bacterium]|nr:class I SAM-dependent methyltransferase [Oscillospiraceae bacterium]